MPTIKFTRENKTVDVPIGTNLRKAALNAGVPLYAGPHRFVNCMGLGQCAACRVNVKNGKENLSRQGLWEWLRLTFGPDTWFARLGNEEQLRLACRAAVQGDVEVETQPAANWHGEKFWG